MEKRDRFGTIKRIFSPIPEVDIRNNNGARFKYPIYLTSSLSDTSIEALELTNRARFCLIRLGINTIGEFCERVKSSADLYGTRQCGPATVAEIMDTLFYYQYSTMKPEKRRPFLMKVIEMNTKE